VNPKGVRDAYFVRSIVRCRPNRNGRGHVLHKRKTLLEEREFEPFIVVTEEDSEYEPYTQRMWQCISTVSHECNNRLGLGSRKSWEGRSVSLNIPAVPREFYLYLRSRMNELTETIKLDFKPKRVKKLLLTDLSVTTTKIRHKIEGFRIEYQDALDAFRTIVGGTFGIVPILEATKWKDVRSRTKPRTNRLTNDTTVRAITCDAMDFDNTIDCDPKRQGPRPPQETLSTAVNQLETPKKQRPKIRGDHTGIDVLFTMTENSVTSMTIAMRFAKVAATSPCVRRAQNGGFLSVSLEGSNGISAGHPDDLVGGSILELGLNVNDWRIVGDRVIQIHDMDGERNVLSVRDNESGEITTLTYQQALEQLT
jgi:hypothetical protein